MTNRPQPPPYALDERSLAASTRVEIFTGGGPGGQHRNKTQNAVRLHHEPSGVVVTATERRSLEANRQAAFERLRERLARLNHVPKKRTATKPTRGSVKRRLTAKSEMARKKADRRRPVDD
jgi:protein subunit release factor A